MKKLLALLLVLTLSLGLMAGCTSEPAVEEAPAETPAADAEAPAEDAAPANEINAAVFYYNYADVYISSVRAELDAKLEEAGISYTNYDGASNQATQTDQINTAVTSGANLLIVNIVDNATPDAAQSAVDLAMSNNIPIIFFNREISADVVNSYDQCSFIGTNTQEAGMLQGDLIGDYLVENFDTVDLNGDGTISYVMFKGQEGNPEAEYRTQFAVENANVKLVEAGKPELAFFEEGNADMYYVDQGGNWSAQAANDYMVTFLSQYSEANGNMIELVIANNDGMAEGAITALNTAGYNTGEEGSYTIPTFGVDATETAQQLIADGKMTGTIKQDAEGMAESVAIFARNVQAGDDFMANTDSLIIDADAAMVRVPYSVYTG